MPRLKTLCLLATTAVSLALSAQVQAATPPQNLLYIESNSTIAGQNGILGFKRNADGSLTPLAGSPFLTGGTGWFDPTYAVGPFDGDDIFAADPLTNIIYAANGGSDTVAALHIGAGGALTPITGSPFATAGKTPDAFALRNRQLIVVSNDADPNQVTSTSVGGYTTGHLLANGAYVEQPANAVARPQTVAPTQAIPVPNTNFVLTNEFRGGTISSYRQAPNGALTLIERQAIPQESGESAQPLPIGIGVHPNAPYVYVGLPNVTRVAVYRRNNNGTLTFIRSVANSGKAPCWVRITKNGQRMYTTNTTDSSISTYDLSNPANPVEIQHLLLSQATGFTSQFSLSPDEKFLYALEEEGSASVAGKSNQVHALAVNQNGTLTELATSPVKLPVPAGNRPQGILVF